MSKPPSPHRPDLKGRQQAAFRRANPDAFGRVDGNRNAVEQLGLIDRRTAMIRERVRAHFQKYQESWVAREAIAIWQKRAGFTNEHPVPDGAPGKYVAQSIMMEARKNVRARVGQRLTRVSMVKTRMENAVVRNRQQMRQQPERSPEPLPTIFRKRSIKQ